MGWPWASIHCLFPIGGSFSRCRYLVFASAAVRCLEKCIGQRDCDDVVQIWIIDNRRVDEKLNRQIGELTGIENLFGKAEAIDLLKKCPALDGVTLNVAVPTTGLAALD